ncbi:MAG: rhodanese-like domain-containing protein [Acidimicrobiales bacterium]
MPDTPSVTDVEPLEARRLAETGALLLDVREDDEWDAGHAPGATHLAMGLVADRIEEIPSDRTLVCVCRVGGRSATVAGALAGVGFDVRNMAGGMLAWEGAGLPITTDTGHAGRIV